VAYTITNPEYLELNGVPLSTPGWEMTEASDLWSGADVRGSDLLMPGAAGVRPYPRRPTVTGAVIEVYVFGDTAWDGTPYASLRAGLATNVMHLAALATPPGSGDGTVAAVLHYAPGAPTASRSGRVHVVRWRFARTGPGSGTGQFELSVPAGSLA
jgi:hypothetical protein